MWIISCFLLPCVVLCAMVSDYGCCISLAWRIATSHGIVPLGLPVSCFHCHAEYSVNFIATLLFVLTFSKPNLTLTSLWHFHELYRIQYFFTLKLDIVIQYDIALILYILTFALFLNKIKKKRKNICIIFSFCSIFSCIVRLGITFIASLLEAWFSCCFSFLP